MNSLRICKRDFSKCLRRPLQCQKRPWIMRSRSLLTYLRSLLTERGLFWHTEVSLNIKRSLLSYKGHFWDLLRMMRRCAVQWRRLSSRIFSKRDVYKRQKRRITCQKRPATRDPWVRNAAAKGVISKPLAISKCWSYCGDSHTCVNESCHVWMCDCYFEGFVVLRR